MRPSGPDPFFSLSRLISSRAVTPKVVRKGLQQASSNIQQPIAAANRILQQDLKGAAIAMGRFVINSSLGIGGLFDVAKELGMARQSGDFGQTLGHYGVDPGPYLVLPFAGPSTTRDALAGVASSIVHPLRRADVDSAIPTITSGMQALIAREGIEDLLQEGQKNWLDPYASVRSYYLQNRRATVAKAGTPDQLSHHIPVEDRLKEGYKKTGKAREAVIAVRDLLSGEDSRLRVPPLRRLNPFGSALEAVRP